jgi:hypothetical protein
MQTQATIAVAPRERFSYARRRLASSFKHLDLAFNLVYDVAGDLPSRTRQYFRREAHTRGFAKPSSAPASTRESRPASGECSACR